MDQARWLIRELLKKTTNNFIEFKYGATSEPDEEEIAKATEKGKKLIFGKVKYGQVAYYPRASFETDRGWEVFYRKFLQEVIIQNNLNCAHSINSRPYEKIVDGKTVNFTKDDPLEYDALYLDIDYYTKYGEQKVTKDNIKEIVNRLMANNITPSCIIKSGYGLHFYWFLENPIKEDKAEILFKTAKKVIPQADSTQDIIRAYRTPGTFNHKKLNRKEDEAPGFCEISYPKDLNQDAVRYEYETLFKGFREALKSPYEVNKEQDAEADIDSVFGNNNLPDNVDEWDIPENYKKLVKNPEKDRDLRPGEGKDRTDSAICFAVLLRLVEAGYSKESIMKAVMEYPFGKHIQDEVRRGKKNYLEKEVNAAAEKIKEERKATKTFAIDAAGTYQKGKDGEKIQVLNCEMKLLRMIKQLREDAADDTTASWFEMEIINSRSHYLDVIPREDFKSLGRFKKHINQTACCFFDKDKNVEKYLDYLIKKSRLEECYGIDYVGYATLNGKCYWISDNLVISENEITDSNKEIICIQKYRKRSEEYDAEPAKLPINFSRISLKDAAIELNNLIVDLRRVLDDTQSEMLMLWCIGCFLKKFFLSDISEGYPILNIIGESGSGKSTTLPIIKKFFGTKDVKSIDIGTTAFAMRDSLTVSDSIPLDIDEFNPSDDPEAKKEMARIRKFVISGYRGTERRTGTKGQNTRGYSMRRPFIVSGEVSVEGTNQSIFERVLPLFFSKEKVTEKSMDIFQKFSTRVLSKNNVNGIAPYVIQEVIRNKDNVQKIYSECSSFVKKLLSDVKLASRGSNNLITLTVAFFILKSFSKRADIECSITPDRFKEVLKKHIDEVCSRHSSTIDGAKKDLTRAYSDIGRVFEMFAEMYMDRKLEEAKEIYLFDQVRDKEFLPLIKDSKNLIWLNFEGCHVQTSMHFQRLPERITTLKNERHWCMDLNRLLKETNPDKKWIITKKTFRLRTSGQRRFYLVDVDKAIKCGIDLQGFMKNFDKTQA